MTKALICCALALGGVTGCGAAMREAMKAPIDSACQSQGLKGCGRITEGVLLYAEGEKEKAKVELVKGVAANAPEQIKEFAAVLKKLAASPALADASGPILEVIAFLEQEKSSRPDAEVVALAKEVTRPKERRIASADRASSLDGEPSRPSSKDNSPTVLVQGPDPDAAVAERVRTRTIIPAGDQTATACDGGMFSTAKTSCTFTRVINGPVLITDVQTAPDCPDELFMVAGPMGSGPWFLGGRPNANLSVHGAQLVVPRDVVLGVGARSTGAAPPRRDARCGITFSYRCLGKHPACIGAASLTFDHFEETQ